jgi:para-aminobenzoate synthetase component 1
VSETVVLVENGPGGRPALFRPDRIIRADLPGEVPAALDALDRALADGHWVAGTLSYELGYCLEPRLAPLIPTDRDTPLLHMAVSDGPHDASRLLMRGTAEAGAASLSPPASLWTAARHAGAMARVKALIAAGDIYQANLTFRLTAEWSGSPVALYAALRRGQAVPHGALVTLPDAPAALSRSPELFFTTDAQGRIATRPMKGTAPRSAHPPTDEAHRRNLAQSAKNRAENLMIVDLLRNDISRIADPGSVRAPSLFAIETYATVHQMTSLVTGQLVPGTVFSGILRALFPCGSVTGAPKIRAMEIIREVEDSPRGIYCGAIGWMGPDGASSFNVAIRTLSLSPGGRALLGVGGGVVHDSTPEGEYEEALWKTRFARIMPG